MKSRPQTIQIFLPDGNPRGIKIAEITNRTIKAALFPRNQFEYMLQRKELTNVARGSCARSTCWARAPAPQPIR